MEHPSSVVWALFLRTGLPMSRTADMAEHLGICGRCRKVVDALPSPPRRILGRPVPAPPGVTILDLENETRKLLSQIRAGSVIRIGGAWHSETLLYQVLALAIARLERQRADVCIAGLVRHLDASPPPPPRPIAILLEAPTYKGFERWLEPEATQTRILVGETEAWLRQGMHPDLVMERDAAESDLVSYMERIEGGARSDRRVVRAAVLASALSVDWPMTLLEPAYLEGAPLPFVSVEDLAAQPTGYVSVEGQWLAGHVLRNQPQLAEALWRDLRAVDSGLPESMRFRLARQWRHWRQI